MTVPLPTVAPQDSWYTLVVGQINPSFAASVPLASYLSPSGGNNGLVGTIDQGVVYLAGGTASLDGGQKWLLWSAASLAVADNVNVFNPYVAPGTPGRWISTTIGQNQNGGTVITAGAAVTLGASTVSIANVVVNKTVGSATAITLPTTVGVWQEFVIKDGKRDAGTNPITILGNGKNIDGAASVVIAVNGGSIRLVFNGTEYNQV